MSEVIIRADNLKKNYRVYKTNWQKIKALLLGQDAGSKRKALSSVDFEIQKGEKVGIIGLPLSGRSTLMKLLCGVIEPDSGSVEVNGKVTPVLDHRMGFQTVMPGLDNYRIRCKLLGWTKEQADEHEDAVFEFAGISKEKGLPMRQYKKGRARRLGFAISTELKPDILVYDETFNFGAKTFADKAVRRLKKLTSDDDTTLVMTVTQRAYAQSLCDRGIVLFKGKVLFDGPFDEALDYYDANVKSTIKEPSSQQSEIIQ
jgi:ABC-type polysaccharide/polyol phosphate transport system ATPase subunit